MNIQDRIASLLTNSYGNLTVPVRNCNFVLNFPDSSQSDIVLLKSFTFPEAGISYSMSADTMFFPIPSITCSPIRVEGYIIPNTANNFFTLYHNQFSNGLLSVKPGIRIGIYLYVPAESMDAPSTLASIYRNGINQSIDLDTLIPKDVSNLSEYSFPDHDKEDLIIPLFVLLGCKFSQPATSPNPASNDFATLTTSVSYINFHTLF